MATKRTIAATALVAILLAASGCSALQGGSGNVDADAIKQNAVDSSANATSYYFDITATSERNGQTSTTNQSGSVNVAEERTRIELSIRGQSITQYLVNGTIYANSSGVWTKGNGSGTNISSNHPLRQQRQFLQNASASFEGNTTIEGKDVYELSVNLTADQLQTNAEQQLGANASAQTTFENISYTVYVTHDSNHIKRTRAEVSSTAQGRQSTSTTNITFSNYGAVSIELPPEAENAQSVNNQTAS